MRSLISFALYVMVFLVASFARAESPAKAPASDGAPPYKGAAVVVVDARYILAHYEPLKLKLRAWNDKLHELQKRHQEEQAQAKSLKHYLSDLVPGSPEYVTKEKELIRTEVESAATFTSQQRQLLRERAKLFTDTYYVIRIEVDQFMKENQIPLVLNVDGDPFPNAPLTLAQLTKEATLTSVSGPVLDDVQDDCPSNSLDHVERLLRTEALAVNRDYDVTPLILGRLLEKSKAEVEADEWRLTISEKQVPDKAAVAKTTVEASSSTPSTARVGRRSRARR